MNRNKTIVILTESMMPFTFSWGACQRVFYYSKQLLSEGYAVTIICKNDSKLDDGITNNEGITVIGLGFSHSDNRETNNKNSIKDRIKKLDRNNKTFSNIIRSSARFAYSEPNIFFGPKSHRWVKKYSEKILRTINEIKPYVTIISGPPFGLFSLVSKIRAICNKIILDYRDPWTLWYEKPTLMSHIEKHAIENSDYIITSTDSLCEGMKKKYPKANVISILNGYDESSWNNINFPTVYKDRIVFSYIGAIWINNPPAFRDASNFIFAANKFADLHNDAYFQFYGVRDNVNDIDKSFKKHVVFNGNIPVKESLVEMMKSHVLIVMHTAHDASGKYIICGKLYDYMKSKKFVLSIGDCADANKHFVETNHIGLHCNNNIDDIISALNMIYMMWKENKMFVKSSDDINVFSRQFQNNKLVDMINNM